MKKVFKTGIIISLLVGLIATGSMAGNTLYSHYNIVNKGRGWYGTDALNTKATTGADWFISVNQVGFGGQSTSGTLGMAHAPGPWDSLTAVGDIFWTKNAPTGYKYLHWTSGYGIKGQTYNLLVRVDSLLYPTQSNPAYSVGDWNSN